MKEIPKTKQGYVMNLKLRARLVALMGADAELSAGGAACRLGINPRTVRDYLTAAVRAEIDVLRRAQPQVRSLEDVDRAMLESACGGNVAAARLVYLRMAQKGQASPLPSLEEMEAELLRLKDMDEYKEKDDGENGACVDDGDAVDSGKTG